MTSQEDLAGRIGRGIVAVQCGEPEHVILAMLRGEAHYEHNDVVFEDKVVTPTDDEREAQGWREAEEYADDHDPTKRAETADDFVAGWRAADRTRRIVQGKPGEHGGTIPLYGMLDVWMALYGTSHPEFDEFYAEHGYADTWARILSEVRERRAVQSEPTDAQVLAALRACNRRVALQLDDFMPEQIEGMRAALRAAFNETGENR